MDATQRQPKLTKGILWLMTVSACLVVANNYYNQPLLAEIAKEFNVTEELANRVSTVTLLGYAAGLFLLVPLGDKYNKKRLIVSDFVLIILSLLAFAFSPNIMTMTFAGFLIGLSSVVPQMFVPLVAQLSEPKERNKNIGIVMSGLLVGILGSRVFSGIVGDMYGWRSVFYLAAGFMLILWLLIIFFLPNILPTFSGTYRDLMRSITVLIRKRKDLRIAAFRGALSLATFQAFWTTLTFYLERPPFFAGSDIAGLLGIVGIGGAMSASYVGRIADKVDKNQIITFSAVLMLLAWVLFGITSIGYIGLVVGIFVLDVGLQSLHVTNQSIIFARDTDATNRLNTVYMTCYFIGGSLGAYIGGIAWSQFQWMGVVATGILFSLILLCSHLLFSRNK